MILVTGGTGLVGSHLLYFLLKNNKKVRAVHRKNSDLQGVKKIFGYYTKDVDALFNAIEWVEANLIDIPALTSAFEGVTHVYHAAAYISFHPKHYYKLKKSNIEGTANIVNLCLAHGVEKVCYVSSIATLGTLPNGALSNEETVWNPEENNSVYAITKYGAEMEVWRGTQEGLNAVIVNPGVILGEGYWGSGSGNIVASVSRGMPFYTSGGVGVIDVVDVVRVMIFLMENPIKNERFILVEENIHFKELLTHLALGLGKKPPKRAIGKGTLLMVSKLDWLSEKLFRTKRKFLKATVASMYTTSFYDGSKIKKEIDFDFVPWQETIQRITKHYSSGS